MRCGQCRYWHTKDNHWVGVCKRAETFDHPMPVYINGKPVSQFTFITAKDFGCPLGEESND